MFEESSYVKMCVLELSWVATPVSYFHTKISYQRSPDSYVETVQKLVIARILALFSCLLKTPIWYEKYERYEIPKIAE